jgi:hypothetical protein
MNLLFDENSRYKYCFQVIKILLLFKFLFKI